MERSSLATEQEVRELKRIGRLVARVIEPTNDRAIVAARRKLFEPKEETSSAGRWVFALAAVGAAAAVAFAIRTSGTPASTPVAAARSADHGNASAKDGFVAADGAKSHVATRGDGAKELVLEQGEARGSLGDSSDVTSVAAGPYRISGNARIVLTWSDTDGLQLDVSDGEARVLAPGMTPVIVTAGASKKLPATP